MAFRIKAKYVASSEYIPENKTWQNSTCDFSFSTIDHNILNNNSTILKGLSIQIDRMRFSMLFNIINQDIIYNFVNFGTNTYHIPKGNYNSKELETLLNTFDKRIQFSLENKLKGQLTLINQSDDDCIITMNRNLLFITGLKDNRLLLKENQKYSQIGISGRNHLDGMFNMIRTIKEVKLYSKHILNYKTEIGTKIFSEGDLKSMFEKTTNLNPETNIIHFSCKTINCDRSDLENFRFYLLDFFDEPVFFDFCELFVYFTNK